MIEFVIDDFAAANSFVKSLPRDIREQRFSIDRKTKQISKWTPDHIVLARLNEATVAMADAIYSTEFGSAANGSLVALKKHGAYALRAFFELRRRFPAGHWESTLRIPTSATVAISRRYFDATYDQGAWELAQGLIEMHGYAPYRRAHPILASKTMLRTYHLPELHLMPEEIRRAILLAAQNPLHSNFRSPNGAALDTGSLLAISFELLKLPMKVRQHTTRYMLIATAVLHGHLPDKRTVEKIVDQREVAKFMDAVKNAC